MEKKELIDSLKDGLIVSCQAVPSEHIICLESQPCMRNAQNGLVQLVFV